MRSAWFSPLPCREEKLTRPCVRCGRTRKSAYRKNPLPASARWPTLCGSEHALNGGDHVPVVGAAGSNCALRHEECYLLWIDSDGASGFRSEGLLRPERRHREERGGRGVAAEGARQHARNPRAIAGLLVDLPQRRRFSAFSRLGSALGSRERNGRRSSIRSLTPRSVRIVCPRRLASHGAADYM